MRWPVLFLAIYLAVGVTAIGVSAGETQLRIQPWSSHGNGLGFGFGQSYDQGHNQGYGSGYGNDTFNPGYGIVCDRIRRACYGRNGYDHYATLHFFGGSFGQGIQGYFGAPNVNGLSYSNGYFQGSGQVFSPRAGILCHSATRTCADEHGMDAHWTGRQFGDSYEERVEDWRGADAFKPGQGIVCDNRRRVCATSRGIEAGWTRFFFGRSASNGYRIIDGPRPGFSDEKVKPPLPAK